MKKFSLLLMVILSQSFILSCSLDGIPSETVTNDVPYNSSDMGNNTSNTSNNDIDHDTFLVSCTPEKFYIDSKCFVAEKDVELDNDDVNDFLGILLIKKI